DNRGRIFKYGEFFPVEFSPFPYIDSNASKFINKDEKEIKEEGYIEAELISNNYVTTLKGSDLPQSIQETTEDILNEVIECVNCEKGYRITQGELNLYKKMNIPPPDQCPKCREKRR